MRRVLANVSVLALTLLVVSVFAASDAGPANAANKNYWMYVFSGANYLSGGQDWACVYNGYHTGHQAVDLHNRSTCSSSSGAVVNMRAKGNTTDPSGGAYVFATATAHPRTLYQSPTCTLHTTEVTVPKPYLGGQAWVERFTHSYRSGDRTFLVGFAYSQYDGGAWLQTVYTVGSMYNEGSGCQQGGYWESWHVHQHRHSLGSGVTGYRNSWFDIPCCSVNNFKVWVQHRELFLWTRTV